MAKIISEYTRMQLTHTAGQVAQEWSCALCGRLGYTVTSIPHESSCILSDPAVTSVVMAGRRTPVELRYWRGSWYWRGMSGTEYRIVNIKPTIQHVLGRYRLYDMSGTLLADKLRLSDIKQWLEQRQGML